jgi:hypothetical protein
MGEKKNSAANVQNRRSSDQRKLCRNHCIMKTSMMLIASELSEGLIENIDPDLLPRCGMSGADTDNRRRENKQMQFQS